MGCDECTHYRVFHVVVTGDPKQPEKHYIYVDRRKDESGPAYLVVGDLEKGHEFVCLPETMHPWYYNQRTKMMRHVAWVAHEHLLPLASRLEHLQPPGRQIEWGELCVPLERVRTSANWTADAIQILLGEGYFVERGWMDKFDRLVWCRKFHK